MSHRDKTDIFTNQNISFIGENTTIDGDISAESGIFEILGKVNGNCNIENLTIRESGAVNGNIKAQCVKIKGIVNGNIKAKSVKLSFSGKIFGDVIYTTLSIEDGGKITGNCKKEII